MLVTYTNGKSFVDDTAISKESNVCARRHPDTFNRGPSVEAGTVVTKGVPVVLQVKSHIARNCQPRILQNGDGTTFIVAVRSGTIGKARTRAVGETRCSGTGVGGVRGSRTADSGNSSRDLKDCAAGNRRTCRQLRSDVSNESKSYHSKEDTLRGCACRDKHIMITVSVVLHLQWGLEQHMTHRHAHTTKVEMFFPVAHGICDSQHRDRRSNGTCRSHDTK